jgi:hypothetical protein
MKDVARASADPAFAVAIVGRSLARMVMGLVFGSFCALFAANFRVPSQSGDMQGGAFGAVLWLGLMIMGVLLIYLGTREFARLTDVTHALMSSGREKAPLDDWDETDHHEQKGST